MAFRNIRNGASSQRRPVHRALWALLFRMLMLWSLCLGWLPLQSVAQTAPAVEASEDSIQAAYLFKFLGYVEWPPASFQKNDAPFVIGVVGDEPVADELTRIAAGHMAGARPVTVRYLRNGELPADLHILFIGREERARQAQLIAQARSRPILIVTETDGALNQGSMINFLIVNDRVRFELSADAADRSGLKLSSRLLTVATNVVKGSG